MIGLASPTRTDVRWTMSICIEPEIMGGVNAG